MDHAWRGGRAAEADGADAQVVGQALRKVHVMVRFAERKPRHALAREAADPAGRGARGFRALDERGQARAQLGDAFHGVHRVAGKAVRERHLAARLRVKRCGVRRKRGRELG